MPIFTSLRVVGYYYLVETFGPVPFYTEENTGVISTTTRTAENTIYSFMIDELEEIKGILNINTNEPGRITNAAVLHFLGKLYLTRGYRNYAEANDFTKTAYSCTLTKCINYTVFEIQI
ncbi:MAG: hypothetical protein LUE98_14465 [Tannerellaceae bacterium]|nr:hypothetical protein [Tannerellaceae bacterium]